MLSFLASTVVPLGSEWLLILMLAAGYDPAASTLTATVGNTLGACTTWFAGRYGGEFLLGRLFRISEHNRQRAEVWYQRYGSLSLLFSWLPVIGDPLCLAGGMLKIRFHVFVFMAGFGKFLRYSAITWLTLQVSS